MFKVVILMGIILTIAYEGLVLLKYKQVNFGNITPYLGFKFVDIKKFYKLQFTAYTSGTLLQLIILISLYLVYNLIPRFMSIMLILIVVLIPFIVHREFIKFAKLTQLVIPF